MNEDSQLEFNDKIQTSQGEVDAKDVLVGGEKLLTSDELKALVDKIAESAEENADDLGPTMTPLQFQRRGTNRIKNKLARKARRQQRKRR